METSKFEAERAALQAEIAHFQGQYRHIVAPGGITVFQMEKVAETTMKQAIDMEATAAIKMGKWQSIEMELKPLKERVDAWKAKYLR